MVDLIKIKSFLRIDGDAEDEILKSFRKTAEEYVKSTCGEFVDINCGRAEMAQLMLISDWYENRSAYSTGNYSRAIDSILTQLRLEAAENEV